ncbi:cytochrome P450 [Aspergillus cavernicola]|uniref:Cytochrome P450 n=1 Tax=Aspergillus cavernicola TaxID=176166 RepID=A0ABR4HPU6_9EURO
MLHSATVKPQNLTFLAMVVCALDLVLTLVAGAILHLFYNYFRLKSIPGPVLASVSDLWQIQAQKSSGYGRRLADLHLRYGGVVRLGPNTVSLGHVGDIASVYRGWLIDELHSYSRGPFSGQQEMLQGEGAIDESLRKIIATIRRHGTVDLMTSLRLFAEEFMFRFLDYPNQHTTAARTPNVQHPSTQPTTPFFATIEELLLRGPVSILKRERLSCNSSGTDVPPTAAIYENEFTSTRIKETRCLLLESSILDAGMESIRTTFVSIFAFLLSNPTVMSRLRNQIDTTPRGWDKSHVPYWGDLEQIPYLDAIMKETMRIVLLQSPQLDLRLTAFPDISLPILPGTKLSWHPYGILCNHSIYGADADIFRPERWLVTNPRRREIMDECLLPFSVCMQGYPKLEGAWLELKKAVVVLLREFDLRLLETEERSGGLESLGPPIPPFMMVRFTPRIPI